MNTCTSVREKILPPRDTRFPHLDTHSQLPAARSVSAPRLQQRLHFPLLQKKVWWLKEKNVTFNWEWLCMKSFKEAKTNPETREGLLSPLVEVTRRELKHWNLVVVMNNFLFCISSIWMHLVLDHPSVQDPSPLLLRQPQLYLEGIPAVFGSRSGDVVASAGQHGETNYPTIKPASRLVSLTQASLNCYLEFQEARACRFQKEDHYQEPKTTSKNSALHGWKKTIRARLDLCSHC